MGLSALVRPLGACHVHGLGIDNGWFVCPPTCEKKKKISWDIFPSWLFRSFLLLLLLSISFFFPSYPDDIFWFLASLFFCLFIYPAWAGTLCRYMIGLCVCLDSLDSSTASTLFFCLSFGIFFLVFSPPFSDSTFDSGEKKIIKNHSPLSFHCPLPVLSSSQRRIFDSKIFTFPPTFFSPPLFLSHFSNMSASIRSTCQRSHSMLIMCARPPFG